MAKSTLDIKKRNSSSMRNLILSLFRCSPLSTSLPTRNKSLSHSWHKNWKQSRQTCFSGSRWTSKKQCARFDRHQFPAGFWRAFINPYDKINFWLLLNRNFLSFFSKIFTANTGKIWLHTKFPSILWNFHHCFTNISSHLLNTLKWWVNLY